MTIRHLALFFSLFLIMPALFGRTVSVIGFGAKADGVSLDTKAVQAAIDACTKSGGGKVVIPAGKTVLVGTLFLKSHVTLYLENGAVLRGSPNIADYAGNTHKNMYKNEAHMNKCLIYAEGAESFAIEGYGTIDGNGYPEHFTAKVGRPMLMRFKDCRDIHLRNVRLINPAAWVSAWLYCRDIFVEGIRIHSRVNKNGDGLDFDGCQNVMVSDCSFDTSDDCICLQASRPDIPCSNIVITNCVFKTKWAGMRIGLLSRGNFESVTVTNCTFTDIQDSGLKIQLNEGGTMKNMVFSNLVMKNVPRPVFMTFCRQRAGVDSPEEMLPMKSMQNFIFSNIIADNRDLDKNSAFFITGLPGHNIENVRFTNIQFFVSGGGSKEDAERENLNEYTPEVLKGWWPEFSLIGTLPASGFYARHVDGLQIDNFQLFVSTTDERPPVVFDDVRHGVVSNAYRNHEMITEESLNRK
ncbi:MAG: glycoside hydrolase family 28 protein [Prolixibacteraceae bacterium]